MTTEEDRARARLEFAACLGLFCTGVYSTAFGPALQVLADDFGVSLDRAGLLITVLFAGSITASGAVAWRFHRHNPRKVAALGMVAVAIGAGGLGFAGNWATAVAAVALTGIGDGLLVAGVHLVVARSSANVARGINRLNLYFAFGAIAGPLWAGGSLDLDRESRNIVFGGIALLVVAVAAVLAVTRAPVAEAVRPPALAAGRDAEGPGQLAWFMGTILFLYVGAEFGLGSWVATYADQQFDAGTFAGGVVTAGYWGALMLGRVVSGRLFAAGWAPHRVLVLSIGGGLISSACIAAANEVFVLAAAAAFATGLCFGPIWPAAISIVSERSGGGAPAAMVTIGNAGGVFFPFAQGRLLVEAGATTGIAMTAALCLAMLLIAQAARVRGRTEARAV
ncbi:MAG: MFS transporter [Dehalococcoidia bacterium]|nr:MFS transporter [Dehalococcoidia bacterium]